jgi:hypothetical protein
MFPGPMVAPDTRELARGLLATLVADLPGGQHSSPLRWTASLLRDVGRRFIISAVSGISSAKSKPPRIIWIFRLRRKSPQMWRRKGFTSQHRHDVSRFPKSVR